MSSSRSAKVDPEALSCTHTSLRRAARRLTKFYDDALSPSGLTSSQALIVASIDQMGGTQNRHGPTLKQLASHLGLQTSALTHGIRPLTKAKLVAIVSDVQDGRVKRATLTVEGERRTRHMYALWRRISEESEALLGKGVNDQLRGLADKVANADFDTVVRKLRTSNETLGDLAPISALRLGTAEANCD
jgi:DNA-binding MarR family transcriptional regulator